MASLLLASQPSQGAFVQNPSFESNWNPTWPHYGSIDSWNGGNGVNDRSLDRGGPFDDNGLTPDGNRVAFKQQGGDLSQDISGLTVGQLYWIQFYYNTRGDVLTGTCDITTRYNGNDLDTITDIQRVTANEGTNPITVPFHSRTVAFVADVDSGTLTFHVNTVGDRTALFDAVTIVPRDTNDVPIMNPSFEASGAIPATGPITNQMAGWAGTGVFGVDFAGGTYADNGSFPDQDLVAFIQGPGAIAQTIPNLVAGASYQLLFAYNAHSGDTPHLQILADSAIVFETDVTAVGGSNPFLTKSVTFTAATNRVVLTFSQTKVGSPTLLLDNVRLLGKTAVVYPPMQVSPAHAELSPGASIAVSFIVPPEKLADSAADIVVSSTDKNIVQLVGADTNGAVALHYAKNGSTTNTLTAIAVKRGSASVTVTDSGGLIVTNSLLIDVVGSLVRNPSFEASVAPGGNGVGAIIAWDGTGTFGLNNISQPFAANSGAVPDRLQVAFIQGAGSLSQKLGNLVPGAHYWLQFCYALTDPGAPGSSIDLNVTLGGQPLVAIPGILPLSQSGATAYYFTNVAFVPTNSSGALQFVTSNPKSGGVLLLDAVDIVRRDPGDLIVQNPSFEASGAMGLYIEGPNTAPLFGWDITGGGRGTASSGPFADNGTIPDQDQTLFLQGADTASQIVSGFTAGQTYTIVYSVNGRGCCGTDLTTHYAVLAGSPGGTVIVFNEDITPVGGSQPYYRRTATFTADAADQQVQFQHVPTGDKTLLLDDIRIIPGTVGASPTLAISAGPNGTLNLTWPASAAGYMVLSATSAAGPWNYDGASVTTQGAQKVATVQPNQTAKFYRLSL